MVWVRTPDDLFERPEVIEAGPAALCLHLAALGYANRQLTDGRIPAGQVPRLTGDPSTPELVEALVAAGWWWPAGGGYQLVYLLDLQPTKAQVERERAAGLARLEAFRSRQKADENLNGRTNGRSNGVCNGVTHGVTHGVRNGDPGPGPGPGPGPRRGPSPASTVHDVGERDSAESRQDGSAPPAPQRKRATTTQVKMAEIIDLVRASGVPIHVTSRDGGVLKSCAAPASLIAEAYVAAARGLWDPGGDRFLPGNLALHMVIPKLAGYQVEREHQNWRYLGPAASSLMRGAGHNVHGPGCDCDLLDPLPAAEPAF